jgi:hypothetical protein
LAAASTTATAAATSASIASAPTAAPESEEASSSPTELRQQRVAAAQRRGGRSRLDHAGRDHGTLLEGVGGDGYVGAPGDSDANRYCMQLSIDEGPELPGLRTWGLARTRRAVKRGSSFRTGVLSAAPFVGALSVATAEAATTATFTTTTTAPASARAATAGEERLTFFGRHLCEPRAKRLALLVISATTFLAAAKRARSPAFFAGPAFLAGTIGSAARWRSGC